MTHGPPTERTVFNNPGRKERLMRNPPTLCGKSYEEFYQAIEQFHGWKAPGVVIGGFMVDLAQGRIGPGVEADAIVETTHCLPDAVQIFTPCTYGNGWMKVVDWDKFALTLYDKKTLEGARVWLDIGKVRRFPDVYSWYMRVVSKAELPLDVLLKSIEEAGRGMLSSTPVQVIQYQGKLKKGKIEVCSRCGEAYPASQGERCLSCQGKGYYEPI
jgi:formylmethanofuran dehydrogenase subunit E